MAVVEEAPGLEVHVQADGNPLREYIDRHTTVSEAISESYIEAKSDSIFEVHYSFKAPFPVDRPVSMIVTIDGKDVDEPLIRPDELYDANGHVSSGPISNDGKDWFTQHYRFSPLDISKSSPSFPQSDNMLRGTQESTARDASQKTCRANYSL